MADPPRVRQVRPFGRGLTAMRWEDRKPKGVGDIGHADEGSGQLSPYRWPLKAFRHAVGKSTVRSSVEIVFPSMPLSMSLPSGCLSRSAGRLCPIHARTAISAVRFRSSERRGQSSPEP